MSASPSWRAAFAATAALLSLASCETPDGKVTVLEAPGAVAPGSSYAWATNPPVANPDPVDNDILQVRLKAAVDAAMSAKGYRQAADPDAAQLVAYHVGVQARSAAEIAGGDAGPPLCDMDNCVWGVFRAPAASAMSLDLTDRASGRLAWRATAETRSDPSRAPQARLNAIVNDMTRTLPGG